MFCGKCGYEVKVADAQFCPRCGAKFLDSAEKIKKPKKRDRRKVWKALAITGAVILCAVLLGLAFLPSVIFDIQCDKLSARKCIDGIYYRGTGGIGGAKTVWVSKFDDSYDLTDVKIPSEIYIGLVKYTVTGIESDAFYRCTSLRSVTIPDTVTRIEYRAFQDCSNLTDVTLSEGIICINSDTFSGCGSLTNITIPDGVLCIDEEAFLNCSSLTDLTLPDSVLYIGAEAFSGCSLSGLEIPDSVRMIEVRKGDYGLAVYPWGKGMIDVSKLGGVTFVHVP